MTRSIEILRGKFSDLEDELGEVAQTEDRFTVQKMTLSNKLEALTKTGDVDQIQKADQVLEYLEGKIARKPRSGCSSSWPSRMNSPISSTPRKRKSSG